MSNPYSIEDSPVWQERRTKFLVQARLRGHELTAVYAGIDAWVGTCRRCKATFLGERDGVHQVDGLWERCRG